jgi:hypothetical protein
MTLPRIYRLKPTDPPWGDYGDILIHGMASRAATGVLELERTGPFVPPISQPRGFAVATAAFLDHLRKSGLKGFESGPIQLTKVPKVDWLEWEPYGTKEMKYPAGGEPENYILRRKHSPEAAVAIGELFEIRFKRGIEVSRDGAITSWRLVDGSDLWSRRAIDPSTTTSPR